MENCFGKVNMQLRDVKRAGNGMYIHVVANTAQIYHIYIYIIFVYNHHARCTPGLEYIYIAQVHTHIHHKLCIIIIHVHVRV